MHLLKLTLLMFLVTFDHSGIAQPVSSNGGFNSDGLALLRQNNHSRLKHVPQPAVFEDGTNVPPQQDSDQADATSQYSEPCEQGLDCVHKKFGLIINRLEAIKSIDIIGNVIAIVKSRENTDIETKAVTGEEPLISRIGRYLRSHSVRLQLPDGFEMEPNSNEGRGRVKKLFFPMVLALKIVLATLLPIFISTVSLLSLKGLWAGVSALFISSALALRALLSRDVPSGFAPRFTVVKPQLYPEVVHHSEVVPAWSRTGGQVQEIQYRGYPFTH